MKSRIYKISLQPNPEKKNEKGDGSRISGTISSKTKKKQNRLKKIIPEIPELYRPKPENK